MERRNGANDDRRPPEEPARFAYAFEEFRPRLRAQHERFLAVAINGGGAGTLPEGRVLVHHLLHAIPGRMDAPWVALKL